MTETELLVQLHDTVKRYEQALRFYADKDTYRYIPLDCVTVTPIELDEGARARKVLYERDN